MHLTPLVLPGANINQPLGFWPNPRSTRGMRYPRFLGKPGFPQEAPHVFAWGSTGNPSCKPWGVLVLTSNNPHCWNGSVPGFYIKQTTFVDRGVVGWLTYPPIRHASLYQSPWHAVNATERTLMCQDLSVMDSILKLTFPQIW